MVNFTGIIIGALICGILYLLDRYLPKWFGSIPGIVFFIVIVVEIVDGKKLSVALLILFLGELLLNGIWMSALQDRKKNNRDKGNIS